MNKSILSLSVIAIFVLSCQSVEQDVSENGVTAPEIIASVETQSSTKTLIEVDELGEGTIYWTPADQINIFYGTVSTLYTSQNTENATTAVFRTTDIIGSTESESTNIWGLYPYNEHATCSGSSVTTTLPANQYGVPETFDDDLFITLAHSTTNALKFYNVCGGIKFSLSRDDISSVTFKGNNNEDIAGDFSITFENGFPKTTVINGLKEIALTPKTGTTFTKDVNYYLIVLPGSLSDGFTMTFTTTDGAVGTFNYSTKAITIKRSVFSKKTEIDTYATFTQATQPNNVIYYTSSDGMVVTPNSTDAFGASILTNEVIDGMGIITFDGEVTSFGQYAFSNCKLTSISIPNSVKSIGFHAFSGCTDLSSLVIPLSVTRIDEGITTYCNGLTRIEVNKDNQVYDSRSNCNAIIRTADNALIAGCKETIIPFSVISIEYGAFDTITSMSAITIPNSVKSIGDLAFAYCKGLSTIDIPSSVSSIGCQSFYYCTNLSSITVRGEIVPTLISDAFDYSNCHIYVPSNSIEAYRSSWSSYADRIKMIFQTIPIETPLPSALDLGLSVKWASFNLGASQAKECGGYYAWGETDPKSIYINDTYKWSMASYDILTKYVTKTSYGYKGFIDGKTVLDPDDDAAHVQLGGTWRIPTQEEMTELMEQCTWEWIPLNGVNGWRVTGTNGNSIFLPAAGEWSDLAYDDGSLGRYWTSTLIASLPPYASCIWMDPSSFSFAYGPRSVGYSIRPVCAE